MDTTHRSTTAQPKATLTNQAASPAGSTPTASSLLWRGGVRCLTRSLSCCFTLLMLLGLAFSLPVFYATEITSLAFRGLRLLVSDGLRLTRSLAETLRHCWRACALRPLVRWSLVASSLGLVCLSLYFMPSSSQVGAVADYYGNPLGAVLRRDNLLFLATLYAVVAREQGGEGCTR